MYLYLLSLHKTLLIQSELHLQEKHMNYVFLQVFSDYVHTLNKMNKDKKIIGVTRKVDGLGRISIPKSYREELGIKEEGEVRIIMINKQVIIEKK